MNNIDNRHQSFQNLTPVLSDQILISETSKDELIINDATSNNFSSIEKQKQAETLQHLAAAKLRQELPFSNIPLLETWQCGSRFRSLCNAEELKNFEIGCAIFQDRVHKVQTLQSILSAEHISVEFKMLLCFRNFGTFDTESIQNISLYLLDLLDLYASTKALIQSFLASKTKEEKHTLQNNLYYLLTFHEKYFSKIISQHFAHLSSDLLKEDHFYGLISSKLCGNATKEYHFLNNFLTFHETSFGLKLIIDNKRIFDEQISITQEAISQFNQSCPIFWLGSVDKKLEKICEPTLAGIKLLFNNIGVNLLEIHHLLNDQINSFEFKSTSHSIISLYNMFGPLFLNTIKRYEDHSKKILDVEKETVTWLETFKEKNHLFRKLSVGHRNILRNYLQTQKNIEEAKKIELEKKEKSSLTPLTIRDPNKLLKQSLKPAHTATQAKKITTGLQSINLDLTGEKAENSSSATQPELCENKTEYGCKVETAMPLMQLRTDEMTSAQPVLNQPGIQSALNDFSNNIQPHTLVSSASASDKSSLQDNTKDKSELESIERGLPPEKIRKPMQTAAKKVKTRPQPLTTQTSHKIETKVKNETLSLPEHLRTEDFNMLVKTLLAETKAKKLKRLFSELNEYGIFSENNEKNNKGYFCIRSPVTNIIHVRTYHHLHVIENQYASIFMAMRDVLIAANIIER